MHIEFIIRTENTVKNVVLFGSFDNWQEGHNLESNIYEISGQKIWSCGLDLDYGRYEYKYVADSEWRLNNDEPTCVSNIGTINNVFEFDENTFLYHDMWRQFLLDVKIYYLKEGLPLPLDDLEAKSHTRGVERSGYLN